MIPLKKILFILHYPPPVHGAAMMGDNIMKSVLINNTFDCSYINLSTSNSVDDIGKSGFIKLFKYLKIISKAIWHCFKYKPNLVYITITSHGLGLIKDSLFVLLCRLFSLPHIFHFHNKGVRSYSNTIIGRIIYPFVFKNAKVILLSPILYDDIKTFVPKSNVYFCSNGIPYFSQNRNHLKNKPVGTVTILFVSNLIKTKGVFDVVEACYNLKKDGVSFNCLIAGGDGDLTGIELNKLICDFELQNFVRYVGKINGDLKNMIFMNSDILLFPTYYHNECFPLVILEAMQFGLPVISTFEGAIPEIVDDGITGFLIPSQNPVLLANKVKEFVNNPLLINTMGQKAFLKFKREYTLGKFETNLVGILNQELYP